MRRTYGLGYFGKGGFVPPPAPQPINVTVQGPDSNPEIAALRAEIEALRNQRMQVIQQAPGGPVNLPPTATQAELVAAGALTLPGVATRGGDVVEGSGGRTEREVLSTPGQTFFTRTTDPIDANLRWDDWRRLQTLLPPNFNEEKYLAKNPDVADAVRKGAMPSGAWHYVMYGMPNCQIKEKKGDSCDPRSLEGWRRGLSGYRRPARRPGYLSGFSPWR